jgi:hypothetical protein
MKAKAQIVDPALESEASDTPAPRYSRTWAMLIKRIYEVDPLACPKCGGVMKVVSFIEPPRPSRDAIPMPRWIGHL